MKCKYNFYSLFAVILLMMSACDKQLDLVPENNLIEEQVLADKVTAERLLAGGFYTQYTVERSGVIPIADQSTGIAYLPSNNFYLGTIDPNLFTVSSIWQTHYKAINVANVIINNLPAEAKFDIISQKQYVAEAKFLRAYSYFRLALLFGYNVLGTSSDANPCLPLQLNPFVGVNQIVPRSTNRQVFDQVVKDLEEAVPDLPSSYPDAQNMDMKLRSRAVKSVGRAFLSRVYLYLNNYDKAIANADLVLADNNYVLAASPADVFPNNKSVIAVPANIPFNKEVVYGYPLSWSTTLSASQANNYQADPAFIQTYTANDIRKTMVYNIGTLLITGKYTSPSFYDNIMVVRLSEVMLNKAEALARRDGLNQTSVDILNTIYRRAFPATLKPVPYTLASFADKNTLVTRILQERRWELAFEGHDRFDKIRSGLPINPVLPLNRYALPIPQAEVDITSGVVVQNFGY